jgi:hypothetical protein
MLLKNLAKHAGMQLRILIYNTVRDYQPRVTFEPDWLTKGKSVYKPKLISVGFSTGVLCTT